MDCRYTPNLLGLFPSTTVWDYVVGLLRSALLDACHPRLESWNPYGARYQSYHD